MARKSSSKRLRRANVCSPICYDCHWNCLVNTVKKNQLQFRSIFFFVARFENLQIIADDERSERKNIWTNITYMNIVYVCSSSYSIPSKQIKMFVPSWLMAIWIDRKVVDGVRLYQFIQILIAMRQHHSKMMGILTLDISFFISHKKEHFLFFRLFLA